MSSVRLVVYYTLHRTLYIYLPGIMRLYSGSDVTAEMLQVREKVNKVGEANEVTVDRDAEGFEGETLRGGTSPRMSQIYRISLWFMYQHHYTKLEKFEHHPKASDQSLGRIASPLSQLGWRAPLPPYRFPLP